jgi:4-diphosphocytidyl-2-C-methyl-D-erythritol kinase
LRVFQAPAKVNLSLLVREPDRSGLHPIDSLVQTIELCDLLTVEEADEERFVVSGAELEDEGNLVVKALRSVRDRVFIPPLSIDLAKEVPMGAGLGGGSSDAAAMLLAATGMSRQPRALAAELAAGIGADVPLFLVGGTLLISGFGELVEPQPALDGFALAIAVPQFELATADVYRHWDRMRGPVGEEAPTRSLPGALRDGMPIRNDLTPAAIDLEPALGDFLADLRDRWETAALMTGSGSACFGFFPDLDEAVDAARAAPDDARLAVGVALRRNGVAEVET